MPEQDAPRQSDAVTDVTLGDRCNVGLLGFGLAARVIHVPLIRSLPDMTLRAVSSRSQPQPADFAGVAWYADYLSLLGDPSIDVVVVATPNDTHTAFAIEALRAGKHVLVEKPFALTSRDATTMLASAADEGRILTAFQNRRYDSDFRTIARIIRSGAIGDVTRFESTIERPAGKPLEEGIQRPGAGVWYDLGPHLVDQAVLLFGPPRSVEATLSTRNPKSSSIDFARVVLNYAQRTVVLRCSLLGDEQTARFAIQGTKGSVLKLGADRQGGQYRAGIKPRSETWGVDPDPAILSNDEGITMVACDRGDHSMIYEDFLLAVLRNGPNPTPAPDVLHVIEVLEAAVRSAQSGKAISFDHV